MTDYHVEQSENYASLSGEDKDPPGRVTLQGAKSLDDLRRVGQLGLEMNHPDVWAALGGGSADQPKPAEKKPAKP